MLRAFLPVMILLAALTAFAAAGPRAHAQGVDDLSRALQVERLMAVMREEGVRYGADLEAELFPGSGGPRWQAIVDRIHDAERMGRVVRETLRAGLADDPAAAAASVAFFAGPIGQRVVELEIAAREALLDETVKDAAELALDDLRAARDPRLALLERFVTVNDLVESNVAGALNSNLAFYRGMVEAGGVDGSLTESDMLADLWSQEDQIREDTRTWLYPYLAMAYQPLSDADLEAYIAFSASPAGQVLNSALFAAFDAMFAMLSHDLGLAAATLMQGEDL
jgi:hypothetical protein